MNIAESEAPGNAMQRFISNGNHNGKAWVLILALAVLNTGYAAVDKVTSSTLAPINTPSAPIPPEALLDVGIPPLGDGLALYLDLHAFTDLDLDKGLAETGNAPEQAAVGDDLVTLCQRLDHFAVFLGLFALRADQEEIKQDDQADRQNHGSQWITRG